MKKLIVIVIMALLVMSFAAAQGSGSGSYQNIKEQHPGLKGLENAKLQVRTEEQQQKLEQVMEKLQEQYRLRLQKLEGLSLEEVDGEVIAKGRKEAKFLGFLKVRRMVQYNIQDDGEMTRTRDLFDFLFTEEE